MAFEVARRCTVDWVARVAADAEVEAGAGDDAGVEAAVEASASPDGAAAAWAPPFVVRAAGGDGLD